MPKPETIEAAATLIYYDPRRAVARDLSRALSDRMAALLHHYPQHFDTRFSSVSGSTCRDTHLPNDLDFDVGLLPKPGCRDWDTALKSLVRELGDQLASDDDICRRMADLFGSHPDVVRESFQNPVLKKLPPDEAAQITILKFRLEDQDRSMIEVGCGVFPWHGVFLHYSSGWAEQTACLSPDSRNRVLSQICLLKFVAKRQNLYGQGAGAPSSRGFEQLVMRHATGLSPLRDLCEEMLRIDEPRGTEVRYPIPNDVWSRFGVPPEKNNVMRAFKREKWQTEFKTFWQTIVDWGGPAGGWFQGVDP